MIKEIDINQLDEVIKLNIESLKKVSKFSDRYNNWRKLYIKETFEKGKMFGYFKDGKIIGGVSIIIDPVDKDAEIRHLFVIKDFRKKGIGSVLMKFIEDYAKQNKVNRLRFDVFIDNKTAIKFYKKKGYETYAYKMEKSI